MKLLVQKYQGFSSSNLIDVKQYVIYVHVRGLISNSFIDFLDFLKWSRI
jgi:hypothetical protein